MAIRRSLDSLDLLTAKDRQIEARDRQLDWYAERLKAAMELLDREESKRKGSFWDQLKAGSLFFVGGWSACEVSQQ